ncbi:DUF4926 domain-containing protein [Desulfonatronum thioautotrophicum]|uniref:DUF4926 domain-containing protein n=1 Tax=Desulfonatronum thioautotrophicum TaxID=617001 RepID=UPI00069982E5|nr:DUF4926 domain-containing protein [Desulfonatronum thioautotrophicum]
MMPDIGDIIEVVTDIPEKNLRAGVRGAVVHGHGNDVYEIEFINDDGETLDFSALHANQFIVVWRAQTRQWIPVAEQTSALVAGLPDDAARQVLNFARFLSVQSCLAQSQASSHALSAKGPHHTPSAKHPR